ncbi:ABC transporter ATP-binding protein [Nocardioides massiliensis]|uniref:ABC transport system ATP-binding protein n=1 Tax=Nocardioides massiliensis TaxID=1325935 RepID=A0ABT9NJR0_9ACTN|nr:ABC transporter ATP-binding protein [Nocardioides massiliensis]MDP9820639.1 putative ABC transport system ATP-binding protein [Nocardioides massiliensis]
MSDLLIEARGLHKAYGRTEALRGVSIDVAAAERVAITGPSGSGKSTLLLSLAGILRPEAGEIRYAGTRLDDLSEAARTRLRRREFGVVLQFGQLVPELTALQNVALPLMLERHDRASADRLARSWLERLDAAGLADAVPGELSGGEAQRVAVARALVTSPRVVFADEPTGALDTVSGEALLIALYDAAKEADAAVVTVTHDNRVAARADREVRLVDGVVA